jgi:hypothetical protein
MVRAAFNPAFNAIGADLQGKAQREAPVAEGTLRSVIHYEVQQTPRGVRLVVSANTPYAKAQHEHTEYKHPKGGKAKYLSDPLKQNANRYRAILAATIKRKIDHV